MNRYLSETSIISYCYFISFIKIFALFGNGWNVEILFCEQTL